MKIPKFDLRWLIGILIAMFFAVSLIYRVWLPHDQVFVGDWVKFTSNDAYYHMRLVDNLIHNFPHLTGFDPYFIFPGGKPTGGVLFFDWLLSVIIWIAGMGSPTQRTVDVIGAYFPAVLAALTVIPVYFIGKALFHRWAGVLAAGLMAVLPGEFLGRSILGFTDNHIAETLFSMVAALFLILALKESRQRQLTFGLIMQRQWEVVVRPAIYSLLAGLFLGIYLITWQGAPMFIFIITLYFIIQFIISHLRRQSTDHLGAVGFLLFLVAAIVFLPFSPARFASIALVIALIVPPLLSVISLLMSGRWKPFYYPVFLIVTGAVFLLIFRAVLPGVFGTMLSQFSLFAPSGATAVTTLEMQPFLAPQGTFSTAVAWGNFTTSFFLTPSLPVPGFAFLSFFVLIWVFIKQHNNNEQQRLFTRALTMLILAAAIILLYFYFIPSLLLLIVFLAALIWLSVNQRNNDEHWLFFIIWTLVILIATLSQRRFAYYLVVNVALLSAYISWQTIWAVGVRQLEARRQERQDKEKAMAEKAKKKRKDKQVITVYHVNVALAIVVVFIGVYLFNIVKSIDVAKHALFAPSDAWEASLNWMKDNTPEPLGDPEAYLKLYDAPPPGQDFKYPAAAYGVASWWDYGYWISRTARRIPSANPSQDPVAINKVARLFLSQEESSAKKAAADLNSRYIIGDYEAVTNKFWAIVTWAGLAQEEFSGTYYFPQGGKLVQVQLLYPEYYQTTLVRLYNFDGKAVTEAKPVVITFADKVDTRSGTRYRQITDFKTDFASYKDAQDYVTKEGAATHRLVGTNPFISPLPLEAVKNYKLVYSSETGISDSQVGSIPGVKVFENIGGGS